MLWAHLREGALLIMSDACREVRQRHTQLPSYQAVPRDELTKQTLSTGIFVERATHEIASAFVASRRLRNSCDLGPFM